MLKMLRNKKTAKKIWIALAILIVPAFVFWGFGSALRSGKQESAYAGKIFGRKVPVLEYKDALNAVKNQAIFKFGDNFSEIQKYLNLESRAWERIILLYEARKRKIAASDKEVIELIESYPFLKRKDRFDSKIYSEMLRYVFHTQPWVFEEETRQNLMLSKLYKQATDNIVLQESEIKEEYRKANEELSLYYIAGFPSDFAKDLAPAEQETRDYFAKNSLQFKQPVSFNLDYISLESEDKIKGVVLRLNKKGDFIQAAKDFGLTVKETGLFAQTDPIPGIGWSAELLNLISKFKIGQFSSPIYADKYYYILRLKERKEAYIPDFEKIKDKVRGAVIKEESERIAKERIEECHKKIKELCQTDPKSMDLEKCAKECGLKSGSTGLFKFGSYIEGIGASDIFWTKAQELKEGEVSEVISIPSGFYTIKLKNRIPMDEKKFDGEKKEFSEKLLEQRKEDYFVRFMDELKNRAQ